MKKLMFAFAISLLAIGTAQAQGWGPGMMGPGWGAPPEAVTLTGTLQLVNGHPAITSGGETYFVMRLWRYSNFIGGITAGANVTIEGIAFGNFLQPSSITVDGTTHSLGFSGAYGGWGPGMMGPGWGGGPGMTGGPGFGGRGGRGGRGGGWGRGFCW